MVLKSCGPLGTEAVGNTTRPGFDREGPIALTKGKFKGLAHEIKGLASVYKQPADGRRTLRLTEFERLPVALPRQVPRLHEGLLGPRSGRSRATAD